ncbi:choline BCCT transporter BetT [Janibacter corallicola]|uniref:choline BCCT transporter BetT n=1 Tax=Janibacter corallicola TaxID=415212 RepID=UPI00082A702B|nr:choline BCCT transporter BetT [Janibacter corallicola]
MSVNLTDIDPDFLADRPSRPRAKRSVLAISFVVIAAIAAWALITPDRAESTLGDVVGWISNWFGWFYIALATAVLVFVVYLGVRHSRVRLGGPDDRPEFSTFSWAAMLFAAGIGTDVMFFAVAEPASQYLAPPQGQAETVEAAREATVWTLFHYGITGWGMYALMGMALGFFAHRKGLPLAVRSALYPLVGKRIRGPIGDAVDIATVLGTIFGVATSLGIGVVMLNVGLGVMFDVPQGIPAQIGLVVVAVGVATISATTGVDRGIRFLSQLNVILAIALALWVLITGQTTFLLRAITMNVGDFVSMFPGMTMDTMAYDHPAEWMSLWTLFFWAWWVAWASFVGMFLARISKGRTIGQFVLGTLIIPFIYIVMWVTIFGNAALKKISDGGEKFGQLAINQPEAGFYTLLQDYPGAFFLVGLATFVGLLFYVTSADSGALVMANLSSELPDSESDGRPWLRILWAVTTGVLTIAMLVVGGIVALQYATIVMGLPFAVVMILVMVGLHRALEAERGLNTAARLSLTTHLAGHRSTARVGSWRQRMSSGFGRVSLRQANARLATVVVPALEEVAEALRGEGREVEVSSATGEHGDSATLSVGEGPNAFEWRVRARQVPAPSYGTRMREASDLTTRLEVALPTGSSYDVYPYTGEQICHDVLDHLERWQATSAMTQLG